MKISPDLFVQKIKNRPSWLPEGWRYYASPSSTPGGSDSTLLAASDRFTISAVSARRGRWGKRYYTLSLRAYDKMTGKPVILSPQGQESMGASLKTLKRAINICESL